MTGGIDWDTVVGYADRLSVVPGERLRVMTSAAYPLESEVVRLPGGDPAPIPLVALADPGRQPVRTGSYVEAPHHERLRGGRRLVVRTWVWLAPGSRRGRRRALISTWGDGGADGFALCLDADGRAGFDVADGGRRDRVVTVEPV
ncbi:MAG: hypothetical protein ABWZ03_00135, partial [Solirubrobacterales bacterium]